MVCFVLSILYNNQVHEFILVGAGSCYIGSLIGSIAIPYFVESFGAKKTLVSTTVIGLS